MNTRRNATFYPEIIGFYYEKQLLLHNFRDIPFVNPF